MRTLIFCMVAFLFGQLTVFPEHSSNAPPPASASRPRLFSPDVELIIQPEVKAKLKIAAVQGGYPVEHFGVRSDWRLFGNDDVLLSVRIVNGEARVNLYVDKLFIKQTRDAFRKSGYQNLVGL